ncbi:stefin-C-like isoform X1 [Hyperolius riggenbachi]|uniref:stefin-C-like isoform X1 n=1 Tax=Hyperolius riggenbachi TaxID=752182 RepID=UPI0035A31880
MSGHDSPDEHELGMAGAYGPPTPADDCEQAVCDQVKPQFLEKSGVNTTMFVAKSYRQQVVAGMNYLIKVQYADDTYAHILVFEPLPGENKPPSLTTYQLDKTEGDELVPFDEEAGPPEGEEPVPPKGEEAALP